MSFQVFLGRESAPADGEWIDAEDLPEALENWDGAAKGEYAITDVDGWDFGHEPTPNEVAVALRFLELVESNYNTHEAAQAYWTGADRDHDDPDDMYRDFEESFRGEFPNDEAFAQAELEDMEEWNPPKGAHWFHPTNYVDWERVARDLMMDYWKQDDFYFRYI